MTKLPVSNTITAIATLGYLLAMSYFVPLTWFRTLCVIGGVAYSLIVQSWATD
jgi:hypothetical protein